VLCRLWGSWMEGRAGGCLQGTSPPPLRQAGDQPVSALVEIGEALAQFREPL
jgi:hypothetical protein